MPLTWVWRGLYVVMLCATSESALRYFSALGVLIWIYEPTAPITRGDHRQETADPFPLARTGVVSHCERNPPISLPSFRHDDVAPSPELADFPTTPAGLGRVDRTAHLSALQRQ